MSKMTTEKHLVRALLNNGAMSKSLFEEELQDQIDEFLKSKKEDRGRLFLRDYRAGQSGCHAFDRRGR